MTSSKTGVTPGHARVCARVGETGMRRTTRNNVSANCTVNRVTRTPITTGKRTFATIVSSHSCLLGENRRLLKLNQTLNSVFKVSVHEE